MGKSSQPIARTTWSMGAVTDDFRRHKNATWVHENETPSSDAGSPHTTVLPG